MMFRRCLQISTCSILCSNNVCSHVASTSSTSYSILCKPTNQRIDSFKSTNQLQARQIRWPGHYWLLNIWNKPDKQRIKEIGPDRAAAQWVIRNGGSIRWKNAAEFSNNYDRVIADLGTKEYHLEAIKAVESSLYWTGFEHLEHCEHVKSISLCSCADINDVALDQIAKHTHETLQHLEVIDCAITDDGIKQFVVLLKNLQQLHIERCQLLQNIPECQQILREKLPNAKIIMD